MLVPVYETKIFYAWLELVVASRTDLALRSAVRQVSKNYTNRVLEIWKELFGSPGDEASAFRMLDQIVNGQFAVIALSRILNGGENDDEQQTDETVEAIKEIGVSLLAKTKRARSKS